MSRDTLAVVDRDGDLVYATTSIGPNEVALTTDPTEQFDVVIVTVATSPIARGEMHFVVKVTNTTSSADSQDITLSIDGTVVDTVSNVSLDAGAETRVYLVWPGSDNTAAAAYNAAVASNDGTGGTTVKVVDSLFETNEDPTLGTVREFTAGATVLSSGSGVQRAINLGSLGGIDTLVFTPNFEPLDAPVISGFGEPDRRLRVEAGLDVIYNATFDEDGTQLSGAPVGTELKRDVSSADGSDNLRLLAFNGLAVMK